MLVRPRLIPAGVGSGQAHRVLRSIAVPPTRRKNPAASVRPIGGVGQAGREGGRG